ncbi:hypothetical protein HS125_14475 [bacterium]|nr:hypothetical protein [bacterium]
MRASWIVLLGSLISVLLIALACERSTAPAAPPAVVRATPSPVPVVEPAAALAAPAVARAHAYSVPGRVAKELTDRFYAVRFEDHEVPAQVTAGAMIPVSISVRNNGDGVWRWRGPVGLAYHLYTPEGKLLLLNGARTDFPRDVNPGDAITVTAKLVAPEKPGRYIISWDLVHQGVAWFSWRGGDTLDLAVEVVPLPQ